MVFPGHFSTGCLRCRQRKVKVSDNWSLQPRGVKKDAQATHQVAKTWLGTKAGIDIVFNRQCDERKPSCQRCHTYGTACPGYTDQFHFRHSRKSSFEASSNSSIISITVETQGCKPKGRRRRRKPEGKAQDDQDQIWSHTLFRPIQPSYDDVSLCYFVRRFVSPDGGDGFPGHLSFLPKIYDHDNPGVLEITTLSVAQMAAYNQFGGDKFRDQSYRNYGRALQMMQEMMNSEDQLTDDKVVTVILLLCTLKVNQYPCINELASRLTICNPKLGC
jgi:hypothetical protein